MQAGADAFALAAAAALDGQAQPNGDDSITRAQRAIDTLVTNKMRLGDAGTANIVASATYYSSLPASDATALSAVTADPRLAKYVRVSVTAANFTPFSPATLLGAPSNTTTTGATA